MELLWRVERFCRRTGLPPTKFGRQVAGDPRLVFDMRRGRQVGPKMRARIEALIGRDQA